jgi:GAF domain-containing protein
MASHDLSLQLVRLLEQMRRADGVPSPEALNQLAATIGSAFKAKLDEVAILRLSSDGMLSFLTPVRLSKLGAIPITSSHSLAAKTIREMRGEFINNFSVYRHPTVFEAVDPSAEQKAAPIQKIISAPIVADGKVVGVIQVSRKGKAGEPVGPDFSAQDLVELTAVGTTLGKLLASLSVAANPGAQGRA